MSETICARCGLPVSLRVEGAHAASLGQLLTRCRSLGVSKLHLAVSRDYKSRTAPSLSVPGPDREKETPCD